MGRTVPRHWLRRLAAPVARQRDALRWCGVVLGLVGIIIVCDVGVPVYAAKQRATSSHASARPKARQPKRASKAASGKSRGASTRTVVPLGPIERTELYAACPSEMVNVAGHFCIDRWEAIVVNAHTGVAFSPYYPPYGPLALRIRTIWEKRLEQEIEQARELMTKQGFGVPSGLGDPRADPLAWLFPNNVTPIDGGVLDAIADIASHRSLDAYPDTDTFRTGDAQTGDASLEFRSFAPTIEAPHGWVSLADAGEDDAEVTARPVVLLPEVGAWQWESESRPMAVSRANEIPQGYTPGFVANQACRAAGKRLCREQEWVFACKGERQTKYPYGDSYDEGRCNVFRHAHPAMMMHGTWSTGLSDPRLNLLHDNTGPLLRRTGHTSWCQSRWGDDAIVDMVGNVDEWVDDPSGVFVGGFYARNTRNGCEARVSNHPTVYFDYSTGFRCCADLANAAPLPGIAPATPQPGT